MTDAQNTTAAPADDGALREAIVAICDSPAYRTAYREADAILPLIHAREAALRQENERLKATLSDLRTKADNVAFHFFHCDGDCGKLDSSIAELAVATGFDQESIMGDEIRAALTAQAEGERHG